MVVYALSKRRHSTTSCSALAISRPTQVQDTSSYADDDKAQQYITQVLISSQDLPHYTYQYWVLRYKIRFYVGASNNSKLSS